MRELVFCLTLALMPLAGQSHPGASTTIEYFSHQIEHQPDSQVLYIRRGIAYSADGQYAQAMSDFNRAQSLGDPVLVSFDLGVLHYRKGEFELALKDFNRYLVRFPDNSACLEYRARLLRDSGDFEASVADFQRVFELQTRPNPGHYISVAEMLTASGVEGVARALGILDAGNSKLGLTPQLQFTAIKLETSRARTDLAVERMLALREMLGESVDWKVGMAELYYENGQPLAAGEMLDAAALQLQDLRRTPARIALQRRIKELRAAMVPEVLASP